jgi:hypothetical protein
LYRKVFEESEPLFYDDEVNVEHFVKKYGEEFVEGLRIDEGMLREFCQLMKQILNKYVEMFGKLKWVVNGKYHSRNHYSSHNIIMTHRRRPNEATKPLPKTSSLKQKTPTKGTRLPTDPKARTPTKTHFQDPFLRKEFGSA